MFVLIYVYTHDFAGNILTLACIPDILTILFNPRGLKKTNFFALKINKYRKCPAMERDRAGRVAIKGGCM